jgi:signal transduction histidine kinase
MSLTGAETSQPLEADAEGLHRLLMNLVGNAIDATADLEDEAGNPVEGRVEINLVTERLGEGQPEWVRVEVSDNGSGVPEDLRREIFKPFVSTKGSKGTGLGLPVSRKIAQEHGGDLILLPNEPNGCRFVLKLPSRILGEKTERAPEAHSPTILQSTSPLADNLPREG